MLKRSIYILSMIFLVYGALFSQGKKGYNGSPQEEINIMLFEKAGIVLSDKQKDLIKDCSLKCGKEMKVFNMQMREYMILIREELIKEKPDRANIKILIQKRKMIEAEIEYLKIDSDLKILETLTEEQKIKFDKFRKSYMSGGTHHTYGVMNDGSK